MPWKIETATEADFLELTSFLDRAFGLPTDFFRVGLGHIYQPKEAGRNWVIRDEGWIVGVFGIFPMTFVIGDVRVSAQGIGGVSADPNYRGQGIMRTFLNASHAELRRLGADISWLGGNRERYGRYGWEHAGAKRRSQIDGDSPIKASGDGVRVVDPSEHFDEISGLFHSMPLRTERDLDMTRRQMARPGFRWWLGDGAYAVEDLDRAGSIIEVAGNAAGTHNLLAGILKQSDGKLSVQTPNDDHAVSRVVQRLAIGAHLGQIGSLKIVDLATLLEKLAPVMAANLAPLETHSVVNLTMHDPVPEDPERVQKVSLRITGPQVEVRRGDWPGPTLPVDRRQLSALIFGRWGETHALPSEFAILRHLFPVPLHVYQLDQV